MADRGEFWPFDSKEQKEEYKKAQDKLDAEYYERNAFVELLEQLASEVEERRLSVEEARKKLLLGLLR